MTINVPPEVEESIVAAVQSGRFRSVDEAVATAWLAWKQKDKPAHRPQADDADPFLGLMRDDAGLMDEIVADAYRHRREDRWREFDR